MVKKDIDPYKSRLNCAQVSVEEHDRGDRDGAQPVDIGPVTRFPLRALGPDIGIFAGGQGGAALVNDYST